MDTKSLEEKLLQAVSEKVGDSLSALVSERVDAEMKKLNITPAMAKEGNLPAKFLGMSEEEVSKMSKTEKSVKFIKAVFHKDIDALRAMKALSE